MPTDLDTTNRFGVGTNGDRLILLVPPVGFITKEQALMLAAYLIVLSGHTAEDAARAIEAVENT